MRRPPAPAGRLRRRGGVRGMPPDGLFSAAVLDRMCADVGITGEQRDAALEWLALLGGGRLREGPPNHRAFASCVLGRLLGYGAHDIDLGPDGAGLLPCGPRRRPLACIEVRGTRTRDLFAGERRGGKGRPSPVRQAWDRMERSGLEYGMCSNYRRFVLLARGHGHSECHQFDLEDARGDLGRLREFVGVFGRAGIVSGFAGLAHSRSAGEDRDSTADFYDLYGRTRLMLVREFEAFGVERGSAVAAAQAVLNRLVFIFFARDTGLAGGSDVFADGVIDVLNGRLGDHSARVWSYLADELFPGFDRGSRSPRIFGFGGGLFGAPLPRGARILDLRPPGFFGRAESGVQRRSWEFKARMWDAAGRHEHLSPIVKNLLAMSSYDFKRQMRVTLLGRIFERSIPDIERLLGLGTSRRKREGVFYTPAYVTRHICRSTIIPWLSRSGRAADAASLVAEHRGDTAGLEKRLRGIRILDPACGSGAFLVAAAETLLDVHREIRAHRDAGGGHAGGTLDPDLADASPLAAVRDSLYGIDTSPQSAEMARLAIYLVTASPFERLPDMSRNIVVRNSVRDAPEGGWAAAFPHAFPDGGGFDVIVGNPPYVRQE